MGGVDLAQHPRLVSIDHAVFLPAAHADHAVAGGKFGVAAVHHLAHGAANHHAVERLRRDIAFAVVHATTHIRVQAQEMVPHQHLALQQAGDGCADPCKVVCAGFAAGALCQLPLVVDGHVGLL